MKFINQNIELLYRNGSVLKFRINTSYATYQMLNKHFKCVDMKTKKYIDKSNNIYDYDLTIDDNIIKAYSEGYTISDILKFTKYKSKATIYNKVRKAGITGRNFKRNFEIDDHYFDNIDTPEKAYLLGIIQTDGSIVGNRLNVTQKREFAWYIYSMFSNITCNVNMINHDSCYKVDISCKNITQKLIEIGIVENKTYNQTNKDIDALFLSIPECYKSDFLRGLIDGDGWVSFYVQKRGVNESGEIGFCARSEFIIDKINEIISKTINYNPHKYQSHNIWYTRIRDINKAIEFGKYLFQNFKYPFGHPKKSIKYINHLNNNFQNSEYGDPNFEITLPIDFYNFSPEDRFSFYTEISKEEYSYKSQKDKFNIQNNMNVEFNLIVDLSNIFLNKHENDINVHQKQYNAIIDIINGYI